MDCTTMVTTRRSVRAYSDQPIPDAARGRVLEAARLAPAANNTQPWRSVVVQDAATRGQLADAAHDQQFVGEAPVVIVCCGQRANVLNVGIAIEPLVLAARNEGGGKALAGPGIGRLSP